MLIKTKFEGFGRDGVRVHNFDMGGSAPDTSGMNAAAVANTGISKETLDFAKQMYADQQPQMKIANDTANKVSMAQLTGMDQQNKIAGEYNDYNKTTFRPLEKGIVADAQNYDTQDRREAEAGKAVSDVSQSIDAAQAQQDRDLSRAGVDPSSGRSLAIRSTIGMQGALGKVQAGANARRAVETQGFARRMDAASLGRNLPSNQAASASLASTMGTNAIGSAAAPLAQAGQMSSMMNQGYGTAINGNNSAGNIYGSMANITNTSNSNSNAWMNAAGSAAGRYMAFLYSK